jgi:hypothetical protein
MTRRRGRMLCLPARDPSVPRQIGSVRLDGERQISSAAGLAVLARFAVLAFKRVTLEIGSAVLGGAGAMLRMHTMLAGLQMLALLQMLAWLQMLALVAHLTLPSSRPVGLCTAYSQDG